MVVRDLVLAEPQLRIAGKHTHPETLGIELQVLEDELPGEVDRAFLEVLAEREVAEHLEEGQVRAVEPDFVDVGRAEALLHRGEQRRRRRLAPEEVGHERLHSCSRQERRAVVCAGDERRRRPEDVPLGLVKGAETRAQLG